MEFGTMDITAIRSGLAAKEFSAREVAEQSLARIDAVDGTVNAFLEVTPEATLAKADEVDAAIAAGAFDTLGPLAGVPVAFTSQAKVALEPAAPPASLVTMMEALPFSPLPVRRLK